MLIYWNYFAFLAGINATQIAANVPNTPIEGSGEVSSSESPLDELSFVSSNIFAIPSPSSSIHPKNPSEFEVPAFSGQ